MTGWHLAEIPVLFKTVKSQLKCCNVCAANPDGHKMRYKLGNCKACEANVMAKICESTQISLIYTSEIGHNCTNVVEQENGMRGRVVDLLRVGAKPKMVQDALRREGLAVDVSRIYNIQRNERRRNATTIDSIQEFVVTNSTAAEAEKGYVFFSKLGDGSDRDPFTVAITSEASMMKLKDACSDASFKVMLHIDHTFKICSENYKALIVGFSDFSHHFHLTAVGLVSHSTETENFEVVRRIAFLYSLFLDSRCLKPALLAQVWFQSGARLDHEGCRQRLACRLLACFP